MEGNCRVFKMAGMGKIKERIIKLDNECLLDWTAEIDPEIFADAIHLGMLISISGLRKVLDES
jgi:hypothetical protein